MGDDDTTPTHTAVGSCIIVQTMAGVISTRLEECTLMLVFGGLNTPTIPLTHKPLAAPR